MTWSISAIGIMSKNCFGFVYKGEELGRKGAAVETIRLCMGVAEEATGSNNF